MSIKKDNMQNGITLIVLVITILVLLILAGVSIVVLTGDNGILENTKTSKEKTKIGEEKEIVKLSQNADLISNDGKRNTKEGLQNELDSMEGTNKTKVIRDGKDSYIVTFLDTNRNYKIKYGKEVEGPIEIEVAEDNKAGDITKGNTLDGSKEKPYQINCIEDWIDFSNKSETDDFTGKEIILTRNLDFLSELAYEDYRTTKYGDMNNDGKTNELMEELTTGTGVKPVNIFKGNFDGQNKKINNLYINSSEANAGLFKEVSNATIKNLIVHGEIFSVSNIGGIAAHISGKCYFYNLEYSGEIGEYKPFITNTGGIIGSVANNSNIEINQCRNTANIIGSGYIGGIIGKIESKVKIKIINSYNEGILILKPSKLLQPYVSVGGILGNASLELVIANCYNVGKIVNEVNNTYNAASGILGSSINVDSTNITNCYNIGETRAKYSYITPFSGGIQGGFWYGQYKSTITNCYYDGSKSDRSVGGTKEEYATKLTTNQIQGKEKIDNQDGTSSTLVELLNKEIENNSTGADTSNWLR